MFLFVRPGNVIFSGKGKKIEKQTGKTITTNKQFNNLISKIKLYQLIILFIRNFGQKNNLEIARQAISELSPGAAASLQALLKIYDRKMQTKTFWEQNARPVFLRIFKDFLRGQPEKTASLTALEKDRIFSLFGSYLAIKVLTEEKIRNLSGLDARGFCLKKYSLNGIRIRIIALKTSSLILDWVTDEIKNDDYRLKNIKFKKNDVVIDIGGFIGLWAIYLAKKYPFIKIYSFEPVPENFRLFQKNIKANKIKNIKVFNLGVTCDKRPINISFDPFIPSSSSGHASLPGETKNYQIKTTTLDEIFEKNKIEKCRLLKIDCEGSEYEILLTARCLNRVQYLSGEMHQNKNLADQGYSYEKLIAHCQLFIPRDRLVFTPMTISD